VWVEDLGSTNGTYVDGVPVRKDQRRRMKVGSELRLGIKNLQVLYRYTEDVAVQPPEEASA
jgi:pSer/pThr/pTyr-binding forkhead associated (FHA) protein